MLSLFLFIGLTSLGYLSGSLCSAVLVAKLFALPDPRLQGSKNPGATNVLRLSGKKYAALVLITDMLKGTLPVLIAEMFNVGPTTLGFVCFAAVLGHVFPIFFEFKGGKGVATALGALLGLYVLLGIGVIVLWLLVAHFWRYSSLASIVAIGLAPFFAVVLVGSINIFPPLSFMALLVLYRHKDNMSRLLNGEEPTINLNRKNLTEVFSKKEE